MVWEGKSKSEVEKRQVAWLKQSNMGQNCTEVAPLFEVELEMADPAHYFSRRRYTDEQVAESMLMKVNDLIDCQVFRWSPIHKHDP